jgi:hypothetical protein
MTDIDFGGDVPHEVREDVMDQIRAGETPLDVPTGYEVQAHTGDSALDVSIHIVKLDST